MKISINVKDSAIDSALAEPHSRYWCPRAAWDPEDRMGWADEPQDDGSLKRRHFAMSQIAKAMLFLLTEHPKVFASIVAGEADGPEGDMLLQLAALGELRYG